MAGSDSIKASLKLSLAQINPTVGDLPGNTAKIGAWYEKAAAQGVDLVICPELSLIGYPPEDLVLMPSLRSEVMRMLHDLAVKTLIGPALLVGSPWEEGGAVFNAALLMEHGKIVHVQKKTKLPNYGIFDEQRLFSAGHGPTVIHWRGLALGIMICEDMWYPELAAELTRHGAELLIVINASPFETGKLAHRKEVAVQAVKQAGVPLVYVNTVGGQDDIVFDGGSFVLSADGGTACQLVEFFETMEIVAIQKQKKGWHVAASQPSMLLGYEEALWRAMILGLGDYVSKNGFPGVVLGLSGGIDSALSAALAVDALGADKVKGVLLPSPYTSKESTEDALHSARLLGIETMSVPITAGMEVFEEALSPVFKEDNWMENVALGGNIQARLRGMTLMSMSNRFSWLLLSTGNKSEIAVGYTTLYGDSCGGYNVLKDLYKTQVYALANWRNTKSEVIPARSITKIPTAELAPGQKDTDQLPPYDVLDQILMYHLEGRLSAKEIIAKNYPKDVVDKVVKMVRMSEYKRRQSCPGVKLSSMLFGRDRRFPLTNKF